MNNTRFAVSLHIMTLLAESGDEVRSSEWLAGSININPVLVRKEISNLRNHGLIESKEGKNGGSMLARSASKIFLSEVFEAVKQESVLGQLKNDPNPDCPVGRQINKHLDALYAEVDNALTAKLGRKTLAEFCKQFR